jgi:hypothetical protein
MNSPRYLHTATLLQNGMVLVAAGHSGAGLLSSAELYNPITGIWTNTGSLAVPRQLHKTMLLPDGRVLVSGGTGSSGIATNSSEIYDPATGQWTLTASLNSGRALQTLTLLPDGRVLVAGGATNLSGSGPFSSAELYDVGLGYSNSWRPQISGLSPALGLSNCLFTGSRFRAYPAAPVATVPRIHQRIIPWSNCGASEADKPSFCRPPTGPLIRSSRCR